MEAPHMDAPHTAASRTGADDPTTIRTYTLCHKDDCCPTLEVGAAGVRVTDDHGGEVRLTTREWRDLVDRVRSGQIG